MLLLSFNVSAQKSKSESCVIVKKNDFSTIIEDQIKLKLNKRKLILTELKYQCVYSAMSTAKVMYDEFGEWDLLEGYIQENSEARFTHGICPDCVSRLYPDLEVTEPQHAGETPNRQEF